MSCCRRTTSCYWVSFGGPVNASTGHVRSHHVPGWENTPYAPLEADFGVPVSVDNDANVAALGHRFGAGQGYDSFMYITVSTGVGGGWILNGRPGMVQRDGRRNWSYGCRPSWATSCVVRGVCRATGFGTVHCQQVRECLQHSPERDKCVYSGWRQLGGDRWSDSESGSYSRR